MFSLHEPDFDLSDEAAILETLRSAWVSTGGPAVDKFESEFAKYTGAQYAVSVSNGTVGLQLVLIQEKIARGISEPFEVIIPSLTFIATANAVVHAGGVPRFIDCSPDSLNFSLASVIATLDQYYRYDHRQKSWVSKDSNRPLLAVMPVNIMGWCGDLRGLAALCQERNIALFEDAAESLGTRLNDGTHTGLIGNAGVFSFNGNKILTTGGGGMIITNDSNRARRLKHLSTTAKVDNLRFVHDEVGYNYRLVGILAALGSSQLKKLPERLRKKSEIQKFYRDFLAKTSCRVYCESNCQPNHWLVNVVFDSHEKREMALKKLNENKIHARPLWTPIHLQPPYRNALNHLSLVNAENAWKTTLSLPSSPSLKSADCEMIAEYIRSVL